MFNPDKPVQTRDGRKARIICKDRCDSYPIVALVGISLEPYIFTSLGFVKGGGSSSELDLINIPETHVRYINYYENGETTIYESRGVADTQHNFRTSENRTACIRVEFKEGQFDE